MPDRPPIPAETSRQVFEESGHRCAVCGATAPLELAHIKPWSQSHEHKAEDLVCVCANCHTLADTKKWGEKTLRRYKNHPWIREQYKRLTVVRETDTRVIIQIKRDLDEALMDNPDLLRCALAGFLRVSAETIRIEFVESNSLRAVLELLPESAEKLVSAYSRRSPELVSYLHPLVSPRAEKPAPSAWVRGAKLLGLTALILSLSGVGYRAALWIGTRCSLSPGAQSVVTISLTLLPFLAVASIWLKDVLQDRPLPGFNYGSASKLRDIARGVFPELPNKRRNRCVMITGLVILYTHLDRTIFGLRYFVTNRFRTLAQEMKREVVYDAAELERFAEIAELLFQDFGLFRRTVEPSIAQGVLVLEEGTIDIQSVLCSAEDRMRGVTQRLRELKAQSERLQAQKMGRATLREQELNGAKAVFADMIAEIEVEASQLAHVCETMTRVAMAYRSQFITSLDS